jgi:Zn-dependent protease
MRQSFHLGRVSGIDIGVRWSIFLIASLLTFTLSGTILPAAAPGLGNAFYLAAALATALLFLGSIVAHELGHSVIAQRNQVGVKGITLFALGGVAELEGEPRNAGAAGRIALAGPVVSVAVGVGSLVAAWTLGILGFSVLAQAALLWLGVINLGLAAFNMLPALPLDGGRVVQAILWHRSGDQHRATIKAARLGRVIGWALVGFGLWTFVGPNGTMGLWTAFIGWFIATSARAEGGRAREEVRRQNWERWMRSGVFGQPASAPPRSDVIDVDLVDLGDPSVKDVRTSWRSASST